MQEINVIIPGGVNVEALDEQLRSALAGQVAGVSVGASGVRVHLTDSATQSQLDQARSIVLAHDPGVLTASQQAEVVRSQNLALARTQYGAPLNVSAYDSAEALVRALAQKISLLEQEIADLRGGR